VFVLFCFCFVLFCFACFFVCLNRLVNKGLPHRYRVAVELMFRTGDITVVFATQTLAQGIHAPARSVSDCRVLLLFAF
jgi:hypothetical protein